MQIGPFIGEFGWELMKWIPYARHHVCSLSRQCKVTAVCYPGREYLYSDFVDDVLFVDNSNEILYGVSDIHCGNKIINETYNQLEISRDLYTTKNLFYRPYGQTKHDHPFDILIHARNTDNLGTNYRNWPYESWSKFVNAFKDKYRIACIGSDEKSMHINDTVDLRGIELSELCSYMASAKLTVGPSSGPMHLASLCGCHHLVWSDNRYHNIINGTNKLRYEDLWNPFKTRCQVIDAFGWSPNYDLIISHASNMINFHDDTYGVTSNKCGKPFIAMVTKDRPDYFLSTIKSIENSNIEKPNLFIFDDNSTDSQKQQLLRSATKLHTVFHNNRTYGVCTNSRYAIDTVYHLCNQNWFIYCQDDVIFMPNWYNELCSIIDSVNKNSIDWAVIALVYYHEPKKWSHDSFHVMKEGHPGGACWAVNKEMWRMYRKENPIFELNWDYKSERLFDYKMSHWCNYNKTHSWHMLHAKKSLVRHIGATSTLSNNDMGRWQGLNILE